MNFQDSYKLQKLFNRIHLYSIPFLKFAGVVIVLALGLALLKHDLAGWYKYILAILALCLGLLGIMVLVIVITALRLIYYYLLDKIEKSVSRKINRRLSSKGTFILYIFYHFSALAIFTGVVIFFYSFEATGFVEFFRGLFLVLAAFMAFSSFGFGLKNLIELIKLYLS